MTIVDVDCTECGVRNSVTAGALLATTGAGDLDTEFGGVVWWICIGCDEVVFRPVAWSVFVRLIRGGVLLIEEVTEPACPPHPEHPSDNPLLTPDDLLELHELLATEDWFDAIATTAA